MTAQEQQYAAILAQLRDHQERERADVADFVNGALAADLERFAAALTRLSDNPIGLRSAFRRIGRHREKVPMSIRKAFVMMWFRNADHLRNQANDDLALISALRALLPPYRGKAVTLYRGDGAWNRKRRTYGVCWSRSQFVAEQHAASWARYSTDGAVLLKTFAPPGAIICALLHHMESIEREYIVDRRHLSEVMVVQRYPVQRYQPNRAPDRS
jgi:hypothetical protein